MLQTPHWSCTHFCLHEIACNIHASVFFLIYLIGGQLLYNIMFCHSSTRIGHSYTRVPSILNPAQASDRPSLPLPPPPQGQASLAQGPILQRALMRPRPGVCSVLSPRPSLQLGKTLTLIFSSFFFFQKMFCKEIRYVCQILPLAGHPKAANSERPGGGTLLLDLAYLWHSVCPFFFT